jgi:carbonic anhydrase/acetyltransferase-like protein (isoleucine patch superfamily)
MGCGYQRRRRVIYSLKGVAPVIDEKVGFIAPSADIIGEAYIAEGVSVWFNAVIRADLDSVTIGKDTNIQDCAVVHTDQGIPTKIGAGVTVGHSAILHGSTVGNNCLIGMGAILLNGAEIGDECIVAAGSLVPQGMIVPPGSLVMGTPAKVVKELKPGAVDAIKRNCASYTTKSFDYLKGLAAL